MAWQSIFDERDEHGLNLTPSDVRQAKTRRKEADQTVDLGIGETYCQVLYPIQSPGKSDICWTAVRVGGAGGMAERVVRKLESSEHLIRATTGHGSAAISTAGKPRGGKMAEEPTTFVYGICGRTTAAIYNMPRLAGFGVLVAAISGGVASISWQTDTFAYAESYDEEADRYLGLQTGQHVEVTRSHEAALARSDRAWEQVKAGSEEPTTTGPEGYPDEGT